MSRRPKNNPKTTPNVRDQILADFATLRVPVSAEQLDEGLALKSSCWSPIAGDQRLAILHERFGEERPAIWNLATGERTDLPPDEALARIA